MSNNIKEKKSLLKKKASKTGNGMCIKREGASLQGH